MPTTINTSGVQCPNPECHNVHSLNELYSNNLPQKFAAITSMMQRHLEDTNNVWQLVNYPACDTEFKFIVEPHSRYHARGVNE